MRKLLPVTILVLALILSVVGCDQVLEVFYPEFAPQEEPEQAFFDLLVFVDIAAPEVGEFSTVVGIVRPHNPDLEPWRFVEPVRVEYTDDKSEPRFFTDFYFGGLPAGFYDLEFFLDRDGDGAPDPEEPLTNSVWVRDPDLDEDIAVFEVGIPVDAAPTDYYVIDARTVLGE